MNMLRSVFTFSVFSLFIFANIFAQAPMEDVVYLKDGSIIRGQIMEQVPGESLRIRIMGGSEFVYRMDEVERIRKEESNLVQFSPKNLRKLRPISYRQPGLYQQIDGSLGFYQAQWGLASTVSLHYKVLYNYNHWINVGLGMGLDPYESGLITPVYAVFQGELMERKTAPHYFVNLGYGIGAARGWNVEQLTGGLYVHAGLGWKINTRRRVDWIFHIGYKYQYTWQERQDWWTGGFLTGSRQYQRIVYGVSMAF
jgi:hypothetical protein